VTGPAAGAADVTGAAARADAIRGGDVRAAARLMRQIDDGDLGAEAALAALYPHSGQAQVVGITGPPGAGKSTLVDALLAAYRAAGERVGVVAVDPSSPLTGGAILGDRIRMQRHALDPGVFIRSLATRGELGGLSRAAADVVTVMDAMGFQRVLVETVGVGQDEVEVARLADTVVVLMVPGLGDEVQAIKAGLLEVADLFVVNKADREGADRVARDLSMMLGLREARPEPDPEILKLSASTGQGVPELMAALARHRDGLVADGGRRLTERRRRQAEARLRLLLVDRTRRRAEAALAGLGGLGALATEVAERRLDPYAAVGRLVGAGS
jgi:LAO/AO transport system kinase